MSTRVRALLIGLLGPTLQAIGLAWEVGRAGITPRYDHLTFRYLIFDPSHLLIFVGLIVTLVSVPVMIEVAQASPHEVEQPLMRQEDDDSSGGLHTEDVLRRLEATE